MLHTSQHQIYYNFRQSKIIEGYLMSEKSRIITSYESICSIMNTLSKQSTVAYSLENLTSVKHKHNNNNNKT